MKFLHFFVISSPVPATKGLLHLEIPENVAILKKAPNDIISKRFGQSLFVKTYYTGGKIQQQTRGGAFSSPTSFTRNIYILYKLDGKVLHQLLPGQRLRRKYWLLLLHVYFCT